jgi:SPP1 family predicted phage head-tail adaptor
MQIGKMRRRCSLQAPPQETEGQNQYGEVVPSWVEVCQVWAAVEPLEGRKLWQAQQVQPDVTHEVRIRYRPGVKTAMRIVYQGRIFAIKAIMDVEERHWELRLMCVEQLL